MPAAPLPIVRPPSLLVSLQNARSLKPKLGDLRAAAAELCGYHLIAITETWLDSTVLDSELEAGLPDHTWFRRDRGSLGGGVTCAVRSNLQPTRLPDPAGSELLLVRLEAVSVTVAVCYRPPDDDAALARLTETLEDLPGSSKLLLVGDINLPEVQWQQRAGQAHPVITRRSSRACRFLDSCGLLGLKQWVHEPTRGPNLLDLVLTRNLSCRASVRDGSGTELRPPGGGRHGGRAWLETICGYQVHSLQLQARRLHCPPQMSLAPPLDTAGWSGGELGGRHLLLDAGSCCGRPHPKSDAPPQVSAVVQRGRSQSAACEGDGLPKTTPKSYA